MTNVELQPVAPGRTIQRRQYLGEFYSAAGRYLGDLHRVSRDEFRVFAVENGRISAESAPLKRDDIRRKGSMRLSASQSVSQFTHATGD